MAVCKVVLNGTTLIDLTSDTVTSGAMLLSTTAHTKTGVLATGNIAFKAAQTYTPGTANQTITSGQYLSGAQTIAGDANLVSANILNGKTIFGVAGNATADATATAATILSGYTAYVSGTKVTGNIAFKTAQTYTPGTANQTIASGQYLSGVQTIAGDANLVSANILKGKTIFGVAGNATADGTASAADILSGKIAYVNGTKVTGNIAFKAAETFTPTTTAQTIASKLYLSGTQTIAGDANLVSANILKGKTIFGVAGNATADATATAAAILSGSTAYVNGAKVTGTIPIKAAQTYTPTSTAQTIASQQYLSGVQTISGDANLVSANILKGKSIFGVTGNATADGTATANDILSGKTAYVNGTKITGSIAFKAAQTYTPTTTAQTIASGQYLSGVQTIAGDANLVSANIVTGVSIFGVNGTAIVPVAMTSAAILSAVQSGWT